MLNAASRLAVVAALTGVWLTVAGTGAAGAAGARTAATLCPVVTGVKWVLPYAPHTSGTKYDLHVAGKITCKQATIYVKRLVQRHVRTNVPFAGGPSGWICKASPSKTGRAYTGTCQPKKESFLPSDHFEWTVG